MEIINKANDNSAEVITTEKDFKRIPQNLKEKISFLEIDMKIKDENKLTKFLKSKINEINYIFYSVYFNYFFIFTI